MPHLIVLVVGFSLSLALTALAIRLGLKLGLADVPGGRRKHARVTSRFGVLPLFGAFTLSALLGRALGVPSLDPNEPTRFAALLLGGGVLFALAVLDDARGLSPAPQVALQLLGAGIAVAGQVFIERFTNPFTRTEVVLPEALGPTLGWIAVIALSLFWFLGMINTVNLLDGVDGLASSVGVIACAVTAVHMLREGQDSVALLPVGMMGVLLGFLIFNRPPARIFLGGGALYLGYTLACIGIVGGAKIALLVLVMGVPIADVLWQIVDRLRRGQSPTHGDRGHLHLRLFDAGWSAPRIVGVYAAVCAALGGAALLPIPPLAKLGVIGTVFLGVVVALRVLANKAPVRA